MLIVVAVTFMFILVLLTFGALYYIVKMVTRVVTNVQPTRQPVVHSRNCPPGTIQRNKRINSVNLIACSHNQRRPQENDERFCQTVGTLKSKKFDRLIKNLIHCPVSFDLGKLRCLDVKGSTVIINSKFTSKYLALINLAGDLYGRILTEVVSTDRT